MRIADLDFLVHAHSVPQLRPHLRLLAVEVPHRPPTRNAPSLPYERGFLQPATLRNPVPAPPQALNHKK